jgi:hypothetical protein
MKPPAGAGGKGGTVDPSLPRFRCQECRRALVVVGVDSYADRLPAHAASGTSTSPPPHAINPLLSSPLLSSPLLSSS